MRQKKQLILVTGASSGLLSRLIALVDSEKCTIRAVSRTPKNHLQSPHDWWIGDITDTGFIREAMEGIDCVIHGAAVTHANRHEYSNVNVRGSKLLVDEALRARVKDFIFISSRVAGEKSGAYGESKWAAEQYIKERCRKWLIFRPSEIYGGKNQEGIDRFIQQVLTNAVMLCPTGIPTPLRPLHIDDAAHLIHSSICNRTDENKIVYINGDVEYSLLSLAKSITSISGTKSLILPIPSWLLIPLGLFLKRLPFNSGIAPDQITRLYSKKNYDESIDYNFRSLHDYIAEVSKKDFRQNR